MFSLTNHNCNVCKKSGHCSLEPIVSYFKDKEDEFLIFCEKVDRLTSGGWHTVILMDASSAKQEMFDAVVALCLATGYLLGKGSEMYKNQPTPSMPELVKGLFDTLDELSKMTKSSQSEHSKN